MAATTAYVPAWSAHQTSCSCGAVVPASEARWGSNTGTFPLHGSKFPLKKFRPYLSCKKAGRWRICSARYDYRGNSAEQAKEEDASTLSEMDTLVENLSQLNTIVNEANKGIGADVRNRVEFLFNRATLLKYSADRMVDGGGRVPVQLTATLKGLQREHASVENIIRLAMEAGPVILDTEDSPSKPKPFLKEMAVEVAKATAPIDDMNQGLNFAIKEKDEQKVTVFESLARESSLKEEKPQPTTSGGKTYVMSTPAAKISSPLSAFRKEIERRVMEQLSGKKIPTSDSDDASEEESGSNVVGLIQNLPLRGRLPRRPRVRGALLDELQSQADAFASPEVRDAPEVPDAPEVQPQMLEGMKDPISLVESQESVVKTEPESEELDKLRRELSDLEQQLTNAKEDSTRADKAEAQLQQVTERLAATMPLDVHEQVVKLERESLAVARTKIAQVTAELKEKEAMLSVVKQEMMAEQENLVGKVRELTGELSKRVSVEEVEAAVNNAVRELEKELGNALKRAQAMQLELETNEKLLKQLQMEWDVERTSLRGELANVKETLTDVQMEQAVDRVKLKEALEKMHEMEEALARLQQALVEAEWERITREKKVLATVRTLIANMVKTKRAQLESSSPLDSNLSETKSSLDSGAAGQMNSVEEVLATMFSGEKAMALETFFVMMGVLIQQESEKLETLNPVSRAIGTGAGFPKSNYLISTSTSLGGGKIKATKPIITLYYESSWEFAYLHYSADGSEWTALPGVCMLNGVFVNNMPLKVIDVEGSSIEFVLTDGRGSWDCAPSGGNYHIKNGGTFLLSSGFIEQKR